MRHSSITGAISLTLLLFLTGCSSQPLYIVDHDPTFDFGGMTTYRWYDDVHTSTVSDYRQYNSSDKRVRTYVSRELKQKGFVELSSGTPDFVVNYSISREEHMEIDNIAGYPSAGMRGGVGAGRYGSSVSVGYSSGPSVKTYKEGTVVIDVIDTGSDQVVWRSLAEAKLKKSLSHQEKDSLASSIAEELMAEFPPEQVKP